MRFSDKVYKYTGENPFGDNQSRTYSDRKVYQEFYPISLFWSLFNDQNEILLGSRGSGKTFLLRMMRYSMLKNIDNEKARQLIQSKTYIALYVPLRLEFVIQLRHADLSEKSQTTRFQEGFNCLLCESLIGEIEALLEETTDISLKIKKQISIITKLEELWFGEKTGICEFNELLHKVNLYYTQIEWEESPKDGQSYIFRKQLGAPLMVAQRLLAEELNLDNDPTWIICIDEAEFLTETMQKCINSFFRSYSNRIALKIATLPYYHVTLETLADGIYVSDGNDFNYRMVDLSVDSQDFIELTNSLCKHRLYERFLRDDYCNSVEDFVGVIGDDDLIDYYRLEVGDENATLQAIMDRIIESFPDRRKKNAKYYPNPRKTIYDKFAPIIYLREMKDLSENHGNRKVGWYAGAKMIRKVSQGNPRQFIQIMNYLFEKAREKKLTPKVQHEVIFEYAESLCKATRSFEKHGPDAYTNLEYISNKLSERIHDGKLVTSGNVFKIQYHNDEEFNQAILWIQVAVAHSRIIVDEETRRSGITKETKFTLGNAFSIVKWIPMRSDTAIKVKLPGKPEEGTNERIRNTKNKTSNDFGERQISLEETLRNG